VVEEEIMYEQLQKKFVA